MRITSQDQAFQCLEDGLLSLRSIGQRLHEDPLNEDMGGLEDKLRGMGVQINQYIALAESYIVDAKHFSQSAR